MRRQPQSICPGDRHRFLLQGAYQFWNEAAAPPHEDKNIPRAHGAALGSQHFPMIEPPPDTTGDHARHHRRGVARPFAPQR